MYRFRKDRDDTGSENGNMKKHQAYHSFNDVGDTRRLILHAISAPSKVKKGKKVKKGVQGILKGLTTQLKNLNATSLNKIAEFVTVTGLDMKQPEHFMKFPELKE